jgi:hypothetical protein
MNLLLKALKELLSEEPKTIDCIFVNDKIIIYLEYSAKEWCYALHFKEEDLIEVEIIDDYKGESIVFGESISTDRDILNEICFDIHPKIMEFKSKVY